MINTTTDLVLLQKGLKFTWGKINKIHTIDSYSIVECVLDQQFHYEYKPATVFFPYVDGVNLQRSADSLDGAILLAIAHKHHDSKVSPGIVNELVRAAAKILDVPIVKV